MHGVDVLSERVGLFVKLGQAQVVANLKECRFRLALLACPVKQDCAPEDGLRVSRLELILETGPRTGWHKQRTMKIDGRALPERHLRIDLFSRSKKVRVGRIARTPLSLV